MLKLTAMTDFKVSDEGTVIALYVISDEARCWADINLPPDTWLNDEVCIIDRRYFPDIEAGIVMDGLTLRPCRK